jgi:hypothetical protein
MLHVTDVTCNGASAERRANPMSPVAWRLLIYRLPTQPSRSRVAIWRELRRLGALPLQQSVVVVPDIEPLAGALAAVEARIGPEGGTSYAFHLRDLTPEQHQQLVNDWNALRNHEYSEIIEECETKFRKEVEFEIFRNNLTGSEAEEIEADLEKIRLWIARIEVRDVFAAERRVEAESAVEECERLLDDFNQRVYLAEAEQGGLSLNLPAALTWDAFPRSVRRPSTDDTQRRGSDAEAEPVDIREEGR